MIFSSVLFPTQCELMERLDVLGQGCFEAVWKVTCQVRSRLLIHRFALQDRSNMKRLVMVQAVMHLCFEAAEKKWANTA